MDAFVKSKLILQILARINKKKKKRSYPSFKAKTVTDSFDQYF